MDTFEEQFGPVGRRLRRVGRGLRWYAKQLTGAECNILAEVRWRLGDEVMALPIYEAIKTTWPKSRLSVLCNHPDLLPGNPFVDEVNPPRPRPDRYICLRSGPRAVYRAAHYAQVAGVPVPVKGPRLYYGDWNSPALDMLPKSDGPLVALSTGASWPTKRWPIEHWRTLARTLQERGCRVFQAGHGDEAIGVGASLLDRTSVRDAACVLHAADLLVCCDSGLMHLGLAAGTRVVALFGPTTPSILIQDEARLVAVRTSRECRGCWNESQLMHEEGVCPLDQGSCLDDLEPETVLAAVSGHLAGTQ